MRGEEARELLGFPLNSRLTPSQVKAAYRKKAWETHPDRFPTYEKLAAESRFKLISEAYTCLQADDVKRSKELLSRWVLSDDPFRSLDVWRGGHGGSAEAMHVRVVRRGVPRAHRANSALIKVPFIILIFGTISLGGLNASRAYRRQKEENPSITKNPFLP